MYRRDYRLRLLDCLRDSYPGLRMLLGEELFDEFASQYLEAQPPHSWTLDGVGACFAKHLQRSRPGQDRWEALIIDLARLERAFVEAYDARGAEGQTLLTEEEIARRPRSWWLGAQLSPLPCLRLMRFDFDVGPYLRAVRRGARRPSQPQMKESFVALCRRDWVVSITTLDFEQFSALQRVMAGSTLGELSQPQAISWLAGWAQAGLLVGGMT